jgi:hypothetical protein
VNATEKVLCELTRADEELLFAEALPLPKPVASSEVLDAVMVEFSAAEDEAT